MRNLESQEAKPSEGRNLLSWGSSYFLPSRKLQCLGPRSAAFAFAVLFSVWIYNFFCRKHPSEIAVLSGPPPDVHLDKVSSPKRSVHEDYGGLAPLFKFMYIGSTSQSVFRRESNRMSVAKKLTSGKEAQAELSIRFWVSNKSLQTYTLFLVPM